MMTAIMDWLKRMDPLEVHDDEEEHEFLRAQQRDILMLNQRMDEIERRHRSKLREVHDDA